MPVYNQGSWAEDLAAWILDNAGDPINLTGVTITVEIYDPTTSATVNTGAGALAAVTGSTGTGDGRGDADNPNVDVAWTANFASLPRGRYRIRAVAIVGGKPLHGVWPLVVR